MNKIMKQEDKRCMQDKICRERDNELLFKDICARLPYGINCEYQGKVHGIVGFNHGKVTIYEHFQSEPKFPFIEEVKPYLFPMSSMTEEERIAIGNEFAYGQPHKAMDILHKRHIDYRGLIEKGLAIDATDKNIY